MMYSERIISNMKASLNCVFLGKTFSDSFTVNVNETNTIGDSNIDYDSLKIGDIKSIIWNRKKAFIEDSDLMNLWKVDIALSDELEYFNEENIENKVEKLVPIHLFSKYFPDEDAIAKSLIIVQVPAVTDYPNKRLRLDFNNIPLDLEQPPTPLLLTCGSDWDYQESPELEKVLRKDVRGLYDVFKKSYRDKSNTPIFFMVSGAGCGKSRNATEFPKILRKIFKDDPELGPRLLDALVFNIPLENGTLLNTREERKANVAIAKRMLYQIQSQEIRWTKIRDDTQALSIDDVLMRCAKQKGVKLKELTVILIIDGLQVALENINDGMDKSSLFYSFMNEIALLVTSNDSPFVIACCTATLARPFNEIIAVSHQRRTFLPIRPLCPPQRDGNPIFKNTPLHNMLINDMGGNGRALEALELALEDIDFENSSFVLIAEKVFFHLRDHYSEWISHTRYLTPVLRAIMTHTTLAASEHIPGTNILPEDLSKLGLVKFERNHELNDKGTLTCPYVWLWLMANASDDKILRNWNFKYYKELQADGDPTIPPGCQFWQHFEHFIASFRVLKSNLFEINKEIKLQDIHAGAKHNFGTATIKNIPLSLEKATRQQSTKSSAYSANKTVTCKKESHQCKCLKSTIVSQKTFDQEREKASDKDDIFILYTRGRSDVKNLPSLSAIVDCDCWKSYFGPFVGRAFLLVGSDKFNINNCTRSELTSIFGIGVKRAELLESLRPYNDLEDCFNKTRISRKFLINFRFD
ncbi:crinkler (CRN) family protein, putative [Rhizophagus clarus]|uniref:Crinkler (CRN) family protein, putative n=1 Tax=Rhizophagus clarus TaxID=94130 RepID=A0A8H3LQF5_9GLOM|nr:crinkler (CRN) family protein, putative [Rhizophagus clarus]